MVKEKYCKNEDGSYNEELCKLIDKITTSQTQESSQNPKGNGKIVAWKTENTGGLAYNTGATDGI